MDYKILDKDIQLKKLGLDDKFELMIHYPEQILQAWDKAANIHFNSDISRICFFHQNSDNLFFCWLKALLENSIELVHTSEDHIPGKDELFIYCQFANIDGLTQSVTLRLADKTEHIDLSHIPSFDGKSIFIGAISRVLNNSGIRKAGKKIKSLTGLMVQKAGALTWRVLLERNYAKILAVKLFEEGYDSILTLPEPGFTETAEFWDSELKKAGTLKGKDKIYLTSFQNKRDMEPGSEIIFADGSELLENLVSLYQLGMVTAIYTKILNNTNKEV